MSEPLQSAINTNFIKNYQTAEYGKFVELLDTKYPAISVTRTSYLDGSQSVDIYPKYAVLTHISNTDDMQFSLSAENINVSLDNVEAQLDTVIDQTNDLEKNTFDTASACDDIFWETVQLNIKLFELGKRLTDSSLFDAFGRMRVSEPKTLVDAKHLYDKLPLLFVEKLSGSATTTFSANDSMVVMSTSQSGDFAIRQSRYHFNYQPGKSLQAFFTGKLHPQAGVIKRMGLYQSLSSSSTAPSDGIYLEVTENGPCFHITKTQGTPHSMSFPRSEWNIDKLDGTGPSGVTIAMSAAQIFVIDYEWLSLGRVRFGFMQSGKTYYAHYVNHINDLDRPYITSPNQPIRYEIIQTGTTPGSMHHICSTVMIEGGEENLGKPIAISDSEVTSIGTTAKVLLAIRLKRAAHDSVVILKGVEALNTGGNAGVYEVILNPTITSGSLTWVDLPNAAIQYSTGGAQLSGGYTLFKSFIGTGLGSASTTEALPVPGEIGKLGINVDDVSDVIVLAGRAFAGNATTSMVGIMNLLERS